MDSPAGIHDVILPDRHLDSTVMIEKTTVNRIKATPRVSELPTPENADLVLRKQRWSQKSSQFLDRGDKYKHDLQVRVILSR